MNTTIEEDVEMVNEEEKPLYSDSLNRGDFVKNVIQIIENLSEQKLSKCYAIKGSWGVGKTHVLDMIEKELFNERRNAEAYDKYVLFHYNAWEYDYYSEPLVSMVASMLESVDEECSFMSPAFKKKFKTMLNGVFKTFGILKKISGKQSLLSNNEKANENIVAQFFDSNYHLNTTMKKLKEGLKKLSPSVTIIVVVDELDRCLPEYAIKVLERLHHIFADIENTQVILSVDYDQLETTVKTIFGENTSTKRYLSKFINFSIALDEGHIEDNFDSQFADYVKNFDCLDQSTEEEAVSLFKRNILDGIDMRKRIEIINQCSLLHTLLNKTNEKVDYSIMCIEILLTLYKTTSHISFGYPHLFSSKNNNIQMPKGLKELNQVYVENENQDERYNYFKYLSVENRQTYVSLCDIWGVLLLCARRINGYPAKDKIFNNFHYDEKEIKKYCDDYWSLLQIIN